MSLSKQLFILIALMFLGIFSVNYVSSVNNIRSYLQDEAEVHAQDTATSLGLSLSPYISDKSDTILETMINAIFDRGYYGEIVLEDSEGSILVRKANPETFHVVPGWFVKLLPMTVGSAESEISSGWSIGGVVRVSVHPGIGYLKLWNQAMDALLYSVLAFALSIVALGVVIRFLLRPLGRINRLALDIARGTFGTISPLPWTTEIRNVAGSMNLMSGKIEGMISNLNKKLESASKKLGVDELTGLEKRSFFETELKTMFSSSKHGYIFLIRIHDLGAYANERDSAAVDEFIKSFVQLIQDVAGNVKKSDIKLYRFFGAEFAAVAHNMGRAEAEQLCKGLVDGFHVLGERLGKQNIAHIGGIAFDPLGSAPSIISAAAEAYEKAKLIGENSFALSQDSSNARSRDEWRELVQQVVSRESFEISLIEQAHALTGDSAGSLVLEEAVSRVFDDEGEALPIGTFVSVAEDGGNITQFDMKVLRRVIAYIEDKGVSHSIAVNLSFSSMSDTAFRSELYQLLTENSEATARLVFSVTAYSAARDFEIFKSFINLAHRCGAKVIMKRFETRFINLNELKGIKLDYIRLARSLTEDIAGDEEKRNLVEAMRELGDLIDVRIIAESVIEDADFSALQEIGLFAASR
ncbi:MAG: LapD/MoxY N-terminal periplasmic domain-containing protein [Candidatus Sedimenticola sp. 6PFRAG5]